MRANPAGRATPRPDPIAGSVALVTGGGTGIGRAVCLGLAERGARAVVVNYSRSAEEAASTVVELESLGCAARAVRADVTDRAAVDRMIADCVADFGGLDILVNNAGTTRLIPFADLDAVTDEDWDTMLGVNLRGAFATSRAAASALRAAHGAIVNVASIAGWRAVGTSIPYGVSKAGMLQLTRSLALALAPEVRVNSVSPGSVNSRWIPGLLGAQGGAERHAEDAASTPLGRVAEPEDIADAVLAMLSVPYLTGQDLLVDGGRSLRF
ncbi:MAG: SDR family NAD(P)-dependent oxidoreductase [Rhodoglobus sp.]